MCHRGLLVALLALVVVPECEAAITTVPLPSSAFATFSGTAPGGTLQATGFAVADAGDVNGDGRGDLIVGVEGYSGSASSAFVLFGPVAPGTLALPQLSTQGFKIVGKTNSQTGAAVAAAGDVNGDGKGDVIVGAPATTSLKGEAYVVFGKSDTASVDLASLGAGGFAMTTAFTSKAGTAVTGLGDLNADGKADVAVGAPLYNAIGNQGGAVYVVFGRTATSAVDLDALGTGGFRIEAGDDILDPRAGTSVTGLGDVNGDGKPEIALGAPGAESGAGRAFVVFGKSTNTTVALKTLGAGGRTITKGATDGGLGTAVADGGDVNGDGTRDLLVGAPQSDANNGRVYVVFGSAATTTLSTGALGAAGYAILGGTHDGIGWAVAGAGDRLGDAHPDVIAGGPTGRFNGSTQDGDAYLIPGQALTGTQDLGGSAVDATLFTGHEGGGLGNAVASVADQGSDGKRDLLLGAPAADGFAGEAFLWTGSTGADPQPTPTPTPATTTTTTTTPPPAPAPTPPAALPALVATKIVGLPSTRKCISRRRIVVHLRAPAGTTLTSVKITVSGQKRARVITGKALKAPVNLRGLPKGRYTITIVVKTADGRSAKLTRRYKTCTRKGH